MELQKQEVEGYLRGGSGLFESVWDHAATQVRFLVVSCQFTFFFSCMFVQLVMLIYLLIYVLSY